MSSTSCCENCSNVNQELEKLKKSADNFLLLKARIINTDDIIRRYQAKLVDAANRTQQIQELRKQNDILKLKCEAAEQQLTHFLNSKDDFEKTKDDYESRIKILNGRIEEMVQQLESERATITLLQEQLYGKNELARNAENHEIKLKSMETRIRDLTRERDDASIEATQAKRSATVVQNALKKCRDTLRAKGLFDILDMVDSVMDLDTLPVQTSKTLLESPSFDNSFISPAKKSPKKSGSDRGGKRSKVADNLFGIKSPPITARNKKNVGKKRHGLSPPRGEVTEDTDFSQSPLKKNKPDKNAFISDAEDEVDDSLGALLSEQSKSILGFESFSQDLVIPEMDLFGDLTPEESASTSLTEKRVVAQSYKTAVVVSRTASTTSQRKFQRVDEPPKAKALELDDLLLPDPLTSDLDSFASFLTQEPAEPKLKEKPTNWQQKPTKNLASLDSKSENLTSSKPQPLASKAQMVASLFGLSESSSSEDEMEMEGEGRQVESRKQSLLPSADEEIPKTTLTGSDEASTSATFEMSRRPPPKHVFSREQSSQWKNSEQKEKEKSGESTKQLPQHRSATAILRSKTRPMLVSALAASKTPPRPSQQDKPLSVVERSGKDNINDVQSFLEKPQAKYAVVSTSPTQFSNEVAVVQQLLDQTVSSVAEAAALQSTESDTSGIVQQVLDEAISSVTEAATRQTSENDPSHTAQQALAQTVEDVAETVALDDEQQLPVLQPGPQVDENPTEKAVIIPDDGAESDFVQKMDVDVVPAVVQSTGENTQEKCDGDDLDSFASSSPLNFVIDEDFGRVEEQQEQAVEEAIVEGEEEKADVCDEEKEEGEVEEGEIDDDDEHELTIVCDKRLSIEDIFVSVSLPDLHDMPSFMRLGKEHRPQASPTASPFKKPPPAVVKGKLPALKPKIDSVPGSFRTKGRTLVYSGANRPKSTATASETVLPPADGDSS